jgi:guanylate kinase
MVGKLFLLSGPSGVGKGTVQKMLKEQHPEFIYPLSVTTRIPRPGEKDGEIYHFVSNEQFDQYIQNEELLEWATVHQYDRYGTLKDPIVQALQEGHIVIREVDVQGWKTIGQSEIQGNVVSIFILPPSLEALKQRIIKRAPISPQELDARLQDMTMEMEYAKDYTYRVISEENQQERVYQEVEHIILSEIQK